jgi:glycosyltransferase involved in cell wall biosynthesis
VLRRIWRRLPAGLRGLVLKVVSRSASPDAADVPPPAPPSGPVALTRPDAAPDGPLRPGALLVGYPKAETGVGQALRGLAQACREAAVPLGVFNFDLNVTARQADDSLSADITGSASHTCNLFCVNADQWPIVRRTPGEGFLARRYNILRPFWELARLPDAEALGLSGLQEIWAPTRFVAGAFKAAVSCPVEIIPVPVLVKPCAGLGREAFGLPNGRFLFLFFFDFASFITRKNPEDIVAAFRRAFPDAAANVGLVIKAHGTGAFEDRRAWLAEQAADPRIVVLDRTMHRAEVDTLTSLADCFVSLHRSEGFGFGMAEAMALGKPVIGTDYSGNTDFLSETTGFPVSFRLVPVPSGTYPGYEDQVWAEPDLDEAAWLMRRVAAGEGNVAERVAAGRACMAENHSAAAVGRICRDRLERLGLIVPQAQ